MKRPVLFLCITVMIIIAAMYHFHIPFSAAERNSYVFAAENALPGKVTLFGKVKKVDERDEYTAVVIKNVSASGKKIGNVRIIFNNKENVSAVMNGLLPGMRICACGTLKVPEEPTVPGQFNMPLYYKRDGIFFTMSDPDIRITDGRVPTARIILEGARRLFQKRIETVLDGEAEAIAHALLQGDREYLDDGIKYKYRSAGVSHLLVISSLHLSIICLAVNYVLEKLKVPYKAASLLSLGIIMLYIIFIGGGVSAIRALCMYSYLTAGKIAGRTYDGASAVSFAALLIMITQPYYLFDAGAQLSFTCVAACVIAAKAGKGAFGVLIYFLTLPLVLIHFSEMPLYGIAANMLLVPLMPFVIGGALLAVCAGGIAAFPYELLIKGMGALTGLMRLLPGSIAVTGSPDIIRVVLYYCAAGGILYFIIRDRFFKRKYLYMAMFPAAVFLMVLRPSDKLKITMLDVGQGESIVIDAPGNFECLSDGGSTSVSKCGRYRILPFLLHEGIGTLEYVFISHGDEDHLNGIEEILEMIAENETGLKIRNIVLVEGEKDNEGYQRIEEAAKRAKVDIIFSNTGDFVKYENRDKELRIDILGPDRHVLERSASSNENSMIMRLAFGSFDMLFTGDTEGAGEERLTEILEGTGEGFEVLKVAHHGSENSTGERFLAAAKPVTALISAGQNNNYGHPSDATLERLLEYMDRDDIYVTKDSGSIAVTTDGKEFDVIDNRRSKRVR